MNILLYTLIFPPDVCSNAYVFTDFSRQLKEFGHNVTVITTTPHYDSTYSEKKKRRLKKGLKPWYKKSNFEGMPVFHIDVATKKGSFFQRLLTFFKFSYYPLHLLELEKIQADVIIAQTPPPTVGFSCSHIAKKLNCKSVLILQDLWFDAMIDKGKIKGPMIIPFRCLEKCSYRNISAICTISEEMQKRYIKVHGNNNPIYVIPNFVDDSLYHPLNGDQHKAKYNISDDDFVISYVGNIGDAQDLEPLLAFAEQQKQNNIKILIAGNGIKESFYKNEVKRRKIKNITFLGYLPREETTIVNSISDICLVMLAKHVMSTSFPSKIYTIMAMGKPILISCNKDSSAGCFIKENKIGWTSDCCKRGDFYNTLTKIIQMCPNEQMKEYGNNAYRIIKQKYSRKVVVSKYIDIIKSIEG